MRRHARYRKVSRQVQKAADLSLGCAILGLILVVIENEFVGAGLYSKTSAYSHGLKMLIAVSTVLLLCLIIAYHALEIQLFLTDNSADDWRIALTPSRVIQITLELVVCSVCPLPGNTDFLWTTTHADGKTVTSNKVSIDVILSIPMFLRLYLVCRVMLLHSKLFTDASSRSIGALNRINFNTRFLMKTLMTLSPGTVLCVVTASFWIVASWILRLCERHHTYGIDGELIVEAAKHENYLNSLWLIAITFLSVGYGDIVPNTYCGRTVAVITGIMGAGTSSLVVAVIARKLELSRAEKHVHNFMMDSSLTKKLKHTAANVLRETWLIYKHRKLSDKIEPAKIRMHQRKFLMAIYELRKVKTDQRKLTEKSLSAGDIAKTTSITYEMVSEMHGWEENMENRISKLEDQIQNLQTQMSYLPDLIAQKLQGVPSLAFVSATPTSLSAPMVLPGAVSGSNPNSSYLSPINVAGASSGSPNTSPRHSRPRSSPSPTSRQNTIEDQEST